MVLQLMRKWESDAESGEGVEDLEKEGACQAELARLCANVEAGDGRLAHCLEEAGRAARARKEESPLTELCREEISGLFFKAARTVRAPRSGPKPGFPGGPKPGLGLSGGKRGWTSKGLPSKLASMLVEPVTGLRESCKEDAAKFCEGRGGGEGEGAGGDANEVTGCLISHKQELQDECRARIVKLQTHQAYDMSLDVQFFKACRSDLTKHPRCLRTKGAKIRQDCLRKYADDLSPACSEQLLRAEIQQGEDVRLQVDVFEVCKEDVARHCQDPQFGEARVLRCLWEKAVVEKKEDFSSQCASQVHEVTKRGLTDYRLDWRLRTRCAHDVEELCQAEKEEADRLTAKQLLAGNATGKVIQCLKRQVAQLKDEHCAQEVRRVARMQGMDAEADPALQQACGEELQRFCADKPSSRKHQCLRRHWKELSEGCQQAELPQARTEGRDVYAKAGLHFACKAMIEQHCKSVDNSQVLRCLQDHKDEESFHRRCKAAVEADLSASNHDWRLKRGISTTCDADVREFCSTEAQEGGGLVLKCLEENLENIHSTPCQQEVKRFLRQGADNIQLLPEAWEACKEDANKFCPGVQAGSGRLHACLLHHRRDLSTACRRAEWDNQKVQTRHFSMNSEARMGCAAVAKKLCPDVPSTGPKMWACLEEHTEDEDMPTECAAVVKSHMKMAHSNFFLNPGMANKCKEDAEELCPEELQAAEAKDFSSHGAVIGCLIEKRKKIRSRECMASLRRKQWQRVREASNDPRLMRACREDIDSACSEEVGKGKGKLLQCLQASSQENALQEACQAEVKLLMEQASEDIRVNMPVKVSCEAATKRWCETVDAGDGQVIQCLLEKMHEEAMEATCRDALLPEQEKRAQSLDFNPQLKKHCFEDLAELARAGKCSAKVNGTASSSSKGWRIDCLTKNYEALQQPDCQNAVRKRLQLESSDLRFKPGMRDACAEDLAELCGSVATGAARGHNCLRQQVDRITNPDCKNMVLDVQRRDNASATLNYQISHMCENERRFFCRDVKPGFSRILICLGMHKDDAGFSESCRGALEANNASKTLSGHLRKGMANAQKSAIDELKMWLQEHRSILDGYGMVLLGGTVGFVALLTAWLSWCWFRGRFGKAGYTVVVPKDMNC